MGEPEARAEIAAGVGAEGPLRMRCCVVEVLSRNVIVIAQKS